MSAKIEVLLVDGGSESERQQANEAGRQAESSGAQVGPRSQPPGVGRDSKPEPPASAKATPSEAAAPRRSESQLVEQLSAALGKIPGMQPAAEAVDRTGKLIDAIQGLAREAQREAAGEVPAGSRRTDDEISREAAERAERTGGRIVQPSGSETSQDQRDTSRESNAERSSSPQDSNAPQRDDYRGLTQAIKGFADRWTPRSIVEGFRAGLGRDRETTVRTERTERETTRERIDRSATEQDRDRASTASSNQRRDRAERSERETIRERIERQANPEDSQPPTPEGPTGSQPPRETIRERIERLITPKDARGESRGPQSGPMVRPSGPATSRPEPQTAIGRKIAEATQGIERFASRLTDMLGRGTGFVAGQAARTVQAAGQAVHRGGGVVRYAAAGTAHGVVQSKAATAARQTVGAGAARVRQTARTVGSETSAVAQSTRVGRAIIYAGQVAVMGTQAAVGRAAGRIQQSAAYQQGSATVGRTVGRIAGRGRSMAPAIAGRGAGSAAARSAGAIAVRSAATGAVTTTAAAGAGAGAVGASGGAAAGGAAAGAAGTAGGIAAVAGPIGLAVAGVVAAFGAAVIAVRKLSDVFVGQADQLQDLSGPIAASRAQGQVRMELARLDRAERIGPETAQIDAASQRLAEATYQVQTQLLELLASQADKIEFGLDTLTAMLQALVTLKEAADIAVEAANPFSGPMALFDEIDEVRNQGAVLAEAVKNIFERNDQPAGQIDPALRAILEIDEEPRPIPPNEGPEE